MPCEWNMVVNDLRALDADKSVRKGKFPVGTYSNTATRGKSEPEKPIGPYEFTRARYPDKQRRDEIRRKIVVAPELGTDIANE